MSNEGEWTTVTSKHSTGHKPQRPLSTVGVGASSSSSSSKAATDKNSGSATKAGHHYPHHHKKPSKKESSFSPASAAVSGSSTQKDSSTKAGNKQTSRSRSSSISSDSDSSQSDDPSSLGSGRPPYHAVIMIHCPFHSCDLTEPLTDSTSLVAHLKEAHKIAFKNIHHMFILLERYLNHWAEEIEAKGIENVAVKENVDDDYYTIDPTISAADRTLRDEIQREKLNEILKVQEKERNEDAKLKRKTILFKHMFAEHNFNIGLPDNLVNVNEFLDMLEAKLTR
ncbi:hypothetical protein BGX21_002918 [Mortierella sp. AD011]|nr:hypothetical protein BGX21_002918 [Mortierella sp. AD011]